MCIQLSFNYQQNEKNTHQKNTKIAFNKYFTSPCVSLSGDRLTTGGDGHAEKRREMREEGCSLPQSMGPLLSGPMEPRGERNRTLAQFSATVSGEKHGSGYPGCGCGVR